MLNAEPQELKCKACGAKLHYEPGVPVLTCAHCGTEYVLDVPGEFTVEFVAEEDRPAAVEAEGAAPEPPPYEADARSCLRRGKYIEAVKVVRVRSGLTLAEAKRYVDELAAREGIPVSRGACAAAAALVVLAAAAGLISILTLLP